MFNLSPQDILGIQEAYESVYLQEDSEQLDEIIGAAIGAGLGYLGAKAGQGFVQGLRGGDKPKPTQSKFAGARDAAFNKAKAIKGSPVVGSKPTPTTIKPTPTTTKPTPNTSATAKPSSSSSTSVSKPAATASPSAKVTPTKPAAAPKPATGMLGKTSFERRTPTSAELKGAQAARASGASPEKALQAAKSAGGALSQATAAASKPPAFSPSSSSPSSSASPKPNLQKSIKANRLNMSFDPFDVVKGYLIGEGFAETEQAAIAIMANMSKEWRQSIIEQGDTDAPIDRAKMGISKYDTRSDRQIRMQEFGSKRLRDAGNRAVSQVKEV